MEKQTKNYVESLNHYPNWLKTITIEIDKILIDGEYINFFMQMYIQWSKDDSYTSSFPKLIIPRLSFFEKLDLSQFKLYIETETMTQFFVCRYCLQSILVQAAHGKEKFFVFYIEQLEREQSFGNNVLQPWLPQP